ncbi:hypothetical protein, partial [Merdimmobilis hominis]|uniref:hypothetical protein n=1 Tax=Merdimmobilis hominis TaxID=2897707 RepID=UPI001FAEABCF
TSDQSELREIQTGRAAPYNVGMMGFLYIEKRTCRMGQQPQQQVRFFLVRVNHGMIVQYEGHNIPLKNGKFF